MINMSEIMKQFEFQYEQIRSQRMLIGKLLERISELQDTIKRVEDEVEKMKWESPSVYDRTAVVHRFNEALKESKMT